MGMILVAATLACLPDSTCDSVTSRPCDVGDEGTAYCVSKDLPHSATLALDGTLRICNGRRCVTNNNLFKSSTPVLAYDQRDEQGGYRCKSEQSGISCTVILAGKGYAKGFLINRAGVRRVGP
jgi:hypothetical protein